MDVDISKTRSISDLGWVSRSTDISLKVPNLAREILIDVDSGSDVLYDYYPFLVYFHIGGQAEFCAEITAPDQNHQIRFPITPTDGRVTLSIRSEQGSRPCDRPSAGADERELAIYINSIAWRAVASTAQTPRSPVTSPHGDPGPIHTQDIRPVFVIGCYRSGTSIATWTIGQHPNIAPMEETNWLPMLYLGAVASYRMAAGRGTSSAPATYDISQNAFLAWQGDAVSSLHAQSIRYFASKIDLQRHANKAPMFSERFQVHRSRHARKARWVDGTPENTGLAIGLSRMFPQAKFVFMLRQPLLVISSLTRFDSIGGRKYTFQEAADLWESMTMRGYEALHRLGTSRVFLTRHERLGTDRLNLLDEWFSFLDEPRFPAAADTLDHVINSSGQANPPRVSQDQIKTMDRLNAIHDGIIASLPFETLPWSIQSAPYEDRENEIVSRLIDCIS